MLTPSVNVVQSSFPEELQGEISGLSRSVSNLGLVVRHGDRRARSSSPPSRAGTAYAWAMGSLIAFGLVGLVAAWLLPAQHDRLSRPPAIGWRRGRASRRCGRCGTSSPGPAPVSAAALPPLIAIANAP